MLKPRPKSRSGFTLTELAIVLGVVGAIIAGIWVAASAVRQKNATTEAAREIGYIVNRIQSIAAINITNLYVAKDAGCSGGVSVISGNSLTANTTAGVFPQEMISGTDAAPIISSPWGQGDVNLVINAQSNSCSINSGNTGPGSPGYHPATVTYAGTFTLTYLSMPVSACEQILLSKGAGFANMGLTAVCVASQNSTTCSQTISLTPTNAVTQLSESAVNAACTLDGTLTSSSSPVSLQLLFLTTTPT